MATSTKTRWTSIDGAGEADGPGLPLTVDWPPLAPGAGASLGTIRMAAIVLPSGDQSKVMTSPSSSVRVAPVLASSRRRGPSGIPGDESSGVGEPMEARTSSTGEKPTAVSPMTGIECSSEPVMVAVTTASVPALPART